MKYTVEESLRNFNFWSGAKDTVDVLTLEQIDTIESMLEDCMGEEVSDTDINDFFWFERDTIAEWLGFSSWDALENGEEEEEEEEEEEDDEEEQEDNREND